MNKFERKIGNTIITKPQSPPVNGYSKNELGDTINDLIDVIIELNKRIEVLENKQLKEALKGLKDILINNQVDLDKDCQDILREDFWNLI